MLNISKTILCALILCAVPSQARELSALGNLEEGVRAYQELDYRRAYRYWILLAQRGVARAQHNVGVLHLRGLGIKKNEKAAFEWFHRAAQQDFTRAQHNLGWMYQNGLYVARDRQQARKWYEAAADKRFTPSENILGEMLYQDKDYQRARAILLRAARKGARRAQFLLAEIFARGLGTAADFKRALRWYRSAANKNDPNAQYQLARLYITSQEGNDAQAIALLKAAAANGHQDALNDLGWMFAQARAAGLKGGRRAALDWFARAARHGHRAAATNIAALYSQGLGVGRSAQSAYMWLLIAEKLGGKNVDPSIIERKQIYATAIKPDERKQAELDALKWLADRAKNKKTEPQENPKENLGDVL